MLTPYAIDDINPKPMFTQEQIQTADKHNMALQPNGDGYDYSKQAFILKGRYVRCGHVIPCNCFGTLHHGEPITL